MKLAVVIIAAIALASVPAAGFAQQGTVTQPTRLHQDPGTMEPMVRDAPGCDVAAGTKLRVFGRSEQRPDWAWKVEATSGAATGCVGYIAPWAFSMGHDIEIPVVAAKPPAKEPEPPKPDTSRPGAGSSRPGEPLGFADLPWGTTRAVVTRALSRRCDGVDQPAYGTRCIGYVIEPGGKAVVNLLYVDDRLAAYTIRARPGESSAFEQDLSRRFGEPDAGSTGSHWSWGERVYASFGPYSALGPVLVVWTSAYSASMSPELRSMIEASRKK